MENEIEEQLIDYLALKNLVRPAIIVAATMCVLIVFFLGLLVWAGLKKLDSNTEYSVDVETDVVTYQPSSQSSPKAYLGTFKLLSPIKPSNQEGCKKYKRGGIYSDGEIKFRKGAEVQVEMRGPDVLIVQIRTKEKEKEKDKDKDKDKEIIELISSEGRCNVLNKFAARIELTTKSPRFMMNMVGGIQAGTKLSYSVDKYFPLLKSGEVSLVDKSFLTDAPVNLPSVELRKGDVVNLLAKKESAAFGLLSAELGNSSLSGVFHTHGGTVQIIKPYSVARPITTSFVDRISQDNELAMVMSVTIFILGILGYFITTLVRLAMVAGKTENNGKNRVRRETKKK